MYLSILSGIFVIFCMHWSSSKHVQIQNSEICPLELKLQCEHDCRMIENQPTCQCFPGFTMNLNSGICEDINECKNENICEKICTNLLGSFKCDCPIGFKLMPNGKSCEDINECFLQNGPCEDLCQNTIGSYECSCTNGTHLAEDKHSCVDVNDCNERSSACSHSCINTHGRIFCTCPAGMELGSDGKNCKDIDECADAKIKEICAYGCVNTIGSYFCAKNSQYILSVQSEPNPEDDYDNEDDYEDEDYKEEDEYEENEDDKDFVVDRKVTTNFKEGGDLHEVSEALNENDKNNLNRNFEETDEEMPTGLEENDAEETRSSKNRNIVDDYIYEDANEEDDMGTEDDVYEENEETDEGKIIATKVEKESNTNLDVYQNQKNHNNKAEKEEEIEEEEKEEEEEEGEEGEEEAEEGDEEEDEKEEKEEKKKGDTIISEKLPNNVQIKNHSNNSNNENEPEEFDNEENANNVRFSSTIDQEENHEEYDDDYKDKTEPNESMDIQKNEKSGINHRHKEDESRRKEETDPLTIKELEENYKVKSVDDLNNYKFNNNEEVTGKKIDEDYDEDYEEENEENITHPSTIFGKIDNPTTERTENIKNENNFKNENHEKEEIFIVSSSTNQIEDTTKEITNPESSIKIQNHKTIEEDDYENENYEESYEENDFELNNHCSHGFKPDELGGCSDINECELKEQNNCSHFCINTIGSYKCSCPKGYELSPSNPKFCQDKNECLNNSCSQICTNTLGSYECECTAGFQLENDSKTCSTINRCKIDNGGCSHFCEFVNGSINCLCPEMHELVNETICVEKNPCRESNNGGCSHICRFINHTIICSCPESHELSKNQMDCSRKNPCLINNGLCSHFCNFIDEELSCGCPDGYYLEGKNCYRDDPCLVNNGGCSHDCYSNEIGEIECSCPDHFNLINRTTCVEVDPCIINNGGCSHDCMIINNQAFCSCPEGYKIENRNCILENPCNVKNGECSHVCQSLNGQIICKCPPKHELIGKTCFKINPCLVNNGGCSHFCNHKNGMRECSCPNGFQLRPNKRICKDVNECTIGVRGGCSHGCRNLPGSYECSCPIGFKLDFSNRTCIDIDECLIKNGNCQMRCKNLRGGYKCGCDEGYILKPDKRFCQLVTFDDCPQLKPPAFGAVHCQNVDDFKENEFVPLGTKCKVSCIEGYKLVGNPERICENTGHWGFDEPYCIIATCPKILQPIQNGYLLPNHCNTKFVYPGESCRIVCKKGYKLQYEFGSTISCDDDMTWKPDQIYQKLKNICIRDIPQPFIKCPNGGEINVILPPGQIYAHVKIPKPESNVDWFKYVDSKPIWGKQLQSVLPAGKTEITFTAFNPTNHNSTSSCQIVINVIDRENPKLVNDCPKNMEYTVYRGESSQLVYWKEPEFRDNVKVVTTYKSREPGTRFGIGLHHINYVASDEAGNRAFCHFTITIKDDPEVLQPNSIYSSSDLRDRYRAVLVCPNGVQYLSKPPDNYNNNLTNEAGCYWRHVRVTQVVQHQNSRIPRHKIHEGSSLPISLRSKHRYFDWYDKLK